MTIRKILLTASLITLILHTFAFSELKIGEFIRFGEYRSPSLSPDGKFFAAIVNHDNRYQITTINIETGKVYELKLRDKRKVYDYEWSDNNHIVYNQINKKFGGQTLFKISRTLENRKAIFTGANAYLIDGIVTDSNTVLVSNWEGRTGKRGAKLYVLNIEKRKIKRFIKDRFKNELRGLSIDPKLNARIAYVSTNDKKYPLTYHYREDNSKPWRILKFRNKEDRYSMKFAGYHPDPQYLYVTTYNNEKTKGLYLYNTKTMSLDKKVFADSEFDIGGGAKFFHDWYGQKIETLKGVRYYGDKPKQQWFDEKYEVLQNTIDSKLPNRYNYISSVRNNLSIVLVKSFSDVVPVEYYVYQKDSDKLEKVGASAPWVNSDEMIKKEIFNFKTEDSLLIHGYLTKPKKGQAPYPTVVTIHGGPWSRDYLGFDREVQLLADRGYAVLQINYRGSHDFGMKISNEDMYKYYKMHRDIINGTEAAIKRGVADPKRIALMGVSFGGYLSIQCAAQESSLYKCVVASNGVYDWERMMKDGKRSRFNKHIYKYMENKLVGSKKEKDEYFSKISPIYHVDNLTMPIFVYGGEKDNVVPIKQSKRLIRKLRRAGNKPEKLILSKEYHWFSDNKPMQKYYRHVISFLKENL